VTVRLRRERQAPYHEAPQDLLRLADVPEEQALPVLQVVLQLLPNRGRIDRLLSRLGVERRQSRPQFRALPLLRLKSWHQRLELAALTEHAIKP